MDIKVMLNNEQIILVEIQILIGMKLEWWKNRSLLYLCRGFDNLGSGDNYDKIMPATQISFVFENLFSDEEPEFYAKYRLLNVRTHKAYTGNFGLNVLCLTHKIELSSICKGYKPLFFKVAPSMRHQHTCNLSSICATASFFWSSRT